MLSRVLICGICVTFNHNRTKNKVLNTADANKSALHRCQIHRIEVHPQRVAFCHIK